MKGNRPVKNVSSLQNETIDQGTQFGVWKWMPFLIAVITAVVYYKAIFNSITTNDDDFYIINNPYLRDFSWHGVKVIFSTYYQSNYHPLTTFAYFVLYNLWGINPLPYHGLNIILHVINVLLVYRLVMQLSGSSVTSAIVTALFALHPMHVESVAWIAELKDVLYTCFYLLSLITYINYRCNGGLITYAQVAVFFLLALLSKPSAVTLPLLLLLIDWYMGARINKSAIVDKIPFFALALFFGIVNIYAQKAGGPVDLLFSRFGFVNGFFMIVSGICWYLLHAIIPVQLSAFHYFPEVTDGGMPWLYYVSAPVLAGIIYLSLRINRHSSMYRDYWFGIAFFVISISVMLQILSVGSALTAERYTYVPYLGLFYILGQYISKLKTARNQQTGLYIIAAIVVVFSIQSYDRIGVWENDETLFTDVIEKNAGAKDVNVIYLLRGNYRSSINDITGAIADYTKAIEINPGFAFAANAFFARGVAMDKTGNLKSALADYSRAIDLNHTMPEAYNKRGYALFRTGSVQNAIDDFATAIKLKPNYPEAYNNRGWALQNSGSIPAALRDYDKAILIAPEFDKPYYNRAALKSNAGDWSAALADYATILKLHPDDNRTMYFMGQAYFNLNNKQQACSLWQQAAQQGNIDARQSLQRYCQ